MLLSAGQVTVYVGGGWRGTADRNQPPFNIYLEYTSYNEYSVLRRGYMKVLEPVQSVVINYNFSAICLLVCVCVLVGGWIDGWSVSIAHHVEWLLIKVASTEI